ncbi:hypothetical protein WME98_50135 [Sorangium sp. So ce296]|uniref:hypothetical protein n=1 Tax=Sorangium sp. So ce296 TaxID=3133296 RepID=UPI003F6461CB
MAQRQLVPSTITLHAPSAEELRAAGFTLADSVQDLLTEFLLEIALEEHATEREGHAAEGDEA